MIAGKSDAAEVLGLPSQRIPPTVGPESLPTPTNEARRGLCRLTNWERRTAQSAATSWTGYSYGHELTRPNRTSEESRFVPCYGRTLKELNHSIPERISDHNPLTVDLPLADTRLISLGGRRAIPSCVGAFRQRTIQHSAIRENYRPLNEVLQLPDVARPRMTCQCRHELLGNGGHWLLHAIGVIHCKMMD